MLSRAKREDLITKYSLPNDFQWADGDDFLTKVETCAGKGERFMVCSVGTTNGKTPQGGRS